MAMKDFIQLVVIARKFVVRMIMGMTILQGIHGLNVFGDDNVIPLLDPNSHVDWRAFGSGVRDSLLDISAQKIEIDVSWPQSTWGVGGMIKLPQAINGRSIKAIRLECRTENVSKTKLYLNAATHDDANITSGRERAMAVTQSWQTFEFLLAKMTGDKPDITSRDFTPDRWQQIQVFKFLFTKPVAESSRVDRIIIRNPHLIYDSTSSMVSSVSKSSLGHKEPPPIVPESEIGASSVIPPASPRNMESEAMKFESTAPIPSSSPQWTDFEPFRTQTALAAKGIDIHAYYTYDYSKVTGGGIRTSAAGRGLLDLELSLNLSTLLGWNNGTFYVLYEKFNGEKGFEDSGDYQFYSNIDYQDNYNGFFEVWLEKFFYEDRMRLKIGKIDASTEFAYVENGAEFLNYSMTISPTIYPDIPVIPNTATGVNLFYYPSPSAYLGVGIYDGAMNEGINTGTHGPETLWKAPDDLFLITEVGFLWTGKQNKRNGRLGLGIWHHTGDFTRFDGGNDPGIEGFYLVLDQTLWRDDSRDKTSQAISSFLQLGHADSHVNEANFHIGTGLVWQAPLNLRSSDQIGIGATWVEFTDEQGAGFTDDMECAMELYYKFKICDNFSIKPDVQYIINPSGDRSIDDATVVTMRLELSF